VSRFVGMDEAQRFFTKYINIPYTMICNLLLFFVFVDTVFSCKIVGKKIGVSSLVNIYVK
jgi:hypothetical protein